jgi:hypothetical protein
MEVGVIADGHRARRQDHYAANSCLLGQADHLGCGRRERKQIHPGHIFQGPTQAFRLRQVALNHLNLLGKGGLAGIPAQRPYGDARLEELLGDDPAHVPGRAGHQNSHFSIFSGQSCRSKREHSVHVSYLTCERALFAGSEFISFR